jgi:hypothetical protein
MSIKPNPHPSDTSLLALYTKLTEVNCLIIIGREGHLDNSGKEWYELSVRAEEEVGVYES